MQAAHVAAQCGASAYASKYIIVVDDDVDVTNLDQLLWAMLTRTDPKESIQFITGSWDSSADPGSVLAPLPQFRGGMGKAVFFQGDFYVMGGETATGSGATAQHVYNRVDIYHPASNTWRQGTPMLTARHGIYPVLDGDRIYVAGGGVTAGASSSALLEVYLTP